MDFELTDAQRTWRDEVRAFLAKNVTPELLHELTHLGAEARGPELREFRRRVGENGWYGLTWPEEFGGLGRGPIDQHILVTEFLYAGVPGPDFTVTSMVPMILQWGTEQNKREFLPGIASGEIFAAIGYSEPGAGTDLASLRTRAELVGDEWVINGSKIWNSFAHSATHEWLLVRTEGPRLTTEMVDVTPEELRVGMRVEAVFRRDDDASPVLLRFKPAAVAPASPAGQGV